MAKADKHDMGIGAKGKGSGTGAMTDLPEGLLEENRVLSNRDKAQHSDARGLDSRHIQTEQFQDHVGARQGGGRDGREETNRTGSSGPSTDTSGDASSLRSRQRG